MCFDIQILPKLFLRFQFSNSQHCAGDGLMSDRYKTHTCTNGDQSVWCHVWHHRGRILKDLWDEYNTEHKPCFPFNCLLCMMLHVTMPGNNAITVSWFLAVLSACLWEQRTWLTTNYGHCGVFPSKRFTIMLHEYYFSLTMVKCIYIYI